MMILLSFYQTHHLLKQPTSSHHSSITTYKSPTMILVSLVVIHLTITFTSASLTGKIMDVTAPVTTVPTITTGNSNPTIQPKTTTSPVSSTLPSGRSWCVATQSASQTALQDALDYACGHGGADCSAIQKGGECYNPDNLQHHASYAFNSYYQKNPIPSSCNFGGTAITTSSDPSSNTCQFPATSTSSSILNTTNSSGATVFGSGPSVPTSSIASPTIFPKGPLCLLLFIHILCMLVVY